MRGNKVKRALCVILAVLLLMVAGAGCGKTTSYNVEEKDFISELMEKVSFDCQLYQVKEAGIESFFTLEEGTKAIVYMGSGSYADHAGIFTAADEKQAEQVLKMVEGYVEDLRHSFEDYIPEEAAKVDKAVVTQKGCYVLLCITNDEGAQEFIDSYFEEHQGDPADGDGQEQGDESGASNEENQDDPAEENSDVKGGGDANPSEPLAEEENYPVIEKKGKIADYGNVIAVGDTAYELYSFTEETGKKYAKVINDTAKALEGTTKVYDLMIPLSSGITLPDALYGEISSTNQEKALNKLTEMMDSQVTVINPYKNLMKHRDEYIYFRTDHHWTADGAYYAYEALCDATGMIPILRDQHESGSFSGFLGSFYTDTKENKNLGENPDDVKVYYPVSPNTSLTYTTTEGKEVSWQVIHDVSDYGPSMKYSTFIAGDNPYTVIKNEDISDGSSCIVVKESFGNALVPFLVDHYAKIYVIDYRYWNGSLTKLAEDKEVDDLFFVNNLSMIRSDYLVGKLAQVQ